MSGSSRCRWQLAGLESRELYRESFTVALPERHPLAARDSIRVADLKGETLLLLEEGHCLRDQALEVCSRVGVRDPQDFRATSLETLRQMVATGAGHHAAARAGRARRLPQRARRRAAPLRQARPACVTSARYGARRARARAAIEALCTLISEHAQ